jgi:hypothetical protein
MQKHRSDSCLKGPHLPARLLRSRPAKPRKGMCQPKPPQAVPGDPTIRYELVARVRREIAAGTYDTPDKWEKTLDRLFAQLDSD